MSQRWYLFIGIASLAAYLSITGTFCAAGCGPGGESFLVCMRAWFGASSGWAAAAGAGAAAVYTVRWLRRQIRLQHLQYQREIVVRRRDAIQREGKTFLAVHDATDRIFQEVRDSMDNFGGDNEDHFENIRGAFGLTAIRCRLNSGLGPNLDMAAAVADRVEKLLAAYDTNPGSEDTREELRLTREVLVLALNDFRRFADHYTETFEQALADRQRIDDQLAQYDAPD